MIRPGNQWPDAGTTWFHHGGLGADINSSLVFEAVIRG